MSDWEIRYMEASKQLSELTSKHSELWLKFASLQKVHMESEINTTRLKETELKLELCQKELQETRASGETFINCPESVYRSQLKEAHVQIKMNDERVIALEEQLSTYRLAYTTDLATNHPHDNNNNKSNGQIDSINTSSFRVHELEEKLSASEMEVLHLRNRCNDAEVELRGLRSLVKMKDGMLADAECRLKALENGMTSLHLITTEEKEIGGVGVGVTSPSTTDKDKDYYLKHSPTAAFLPQMQSPSHLPLSKIDSGDYHHTDKDKDRNIENRLDVAMEKLMNRKIEVKGSPSHSPNNHSHNHTTNEHQHQRQNHYNHQQQQQQSDINTEKRLQEAYELLHKQEIELKDKVILETELIRVKQILKELQLQDRDRVDRDSNNDSQSSLLRDRGNGNGDGRNKRNHDVVVNACIHDTETETETETGAWLELKGKNTVFTKNQQKTQQLNDSDATLMKAEIMKAEGRVLDLEILLYQQDEELVSQRKTIASLSSVSSSSSSVSKDVMSTSKVRIEELEMLLKECEEKKNIANASRKVVEERVVELQQLLQEKKAALLCSEAARVNIETESLREIENILKLQESNCMAMESRLTVVEQALGECQHALKEKESLLETSEQCLLNLKISHKNAIDSIVQCKDDELVAVNHRLLAAENVLLQKDKEFDEYKDVFNRCKIMEQHVDSVEHQLQSSRTVVEEQAAVLLTMMTSLTEKDRLLTAKDSSNKALEDAVCKLETVVIKGLEIEVASLQQVVTDTQSQIVGYKEVIARLEEEVRSNSVLIQEKNTAMQGCNVRLQGVEGMLSLREEKILRLEALVEKRDDELRELNDLIVEIYASLHETERLLEEERTELRMKGGRDVLQYRDRLEATERNLEECRQQLCASREECQQVQTELSELTLSYETKLVGLQERFDECGKRATHLEETLNETTNELEDARHNVQEKTLLLSENGSRMQQLGSLLSDTEAELVSVTTRLTELNEIMETKQIESSRQCQLEDQSELLAEKELRVRDLELRQSATEMALRELDSKYAASLTAIDDLEGQLLESGLAHARQISIANTEASNVGMTAFYFEDKLKEAEGVLLEKDNVIHSLMTKLETLRKSSSSSSSSWSVGGNHIEEMFGFKKHVEPDATEIQELKHQLQRTETNHGSPSSSSSSSSSEQDSSADAESLPVSMMGMVDSTIYVRLLRHVDQLKTELEQERMWRLEAEDIVIGLRGSSGNSVPVKQASP
eukprot:gene1832-3546_t